MSLKNNLGFHKSEGRRELSQEAVEGLTGAGQGRLCGPQHCARFSGVEEPLL